ncbi:hypothetical protein ACLOJK_036440 [Asimina triloba]
MSEVAWQKGVSPLRGREPVPQRSSSGRLPSSFSRFGLCCFKVRASKGAVPAFISFTFPFTFRYLNGGQKGDISSEDLGSIRSHYRILDSIELFAPREGETLRDHQDGNIYLNEWMFKAGVRIPFDFGISELPHVFGAAPIQVYPNSWKKVILGCVTFVGKRNMKIVSNLLNSGGTPCWGVPLRWSEGLLEVVSTAPKELEAGQRMLLKFFQLCNLKWCPSKEAFFRWCQGLSFFGAPAVFVPEEAKERQLGEASGHGLEYRPYRIRYAYIGSISADIPFPASGSSADARPLTGGTIRGVPEEEQTLGERYRLLAPNFFFFPFVPKKIGHEGKGLTIPDDEEWLARKEVDLQAELALSCEETRSFRIVGALSFAPSFEKEPSGTPVWAALEGAEARAVVDRGLEPQCRSNLEEAGASMRLGVLGATLGEMSSGSVNGQLFRHPFDIEARALKILCGLLPELMELEERICLIDGCSSWGKYYYPMLKECVRLSLGRPQEERRKIIAVGKRPEESGMAQVTREVLRPDASFPSNWEHLEESLAGIISEACRMAGEELRGERRFFFQLLKMDRRANRVKALQERAKEAVAKLIHEAELLVELDASRAKRDEARDDVEGAAFTKQDLEQTLEEATAKATGLCLQKLNAKTSIQPLSDQAACAQEEASKLSLELDTAKVEVTWLEEELKAPKLESLQGIKDDASGKVSGLAFGEHQALIISEYLRGGTHQRREEFERSHYAHDGFMKAMSAIATLYLKLNLSSLNRRPEKKKEYKEREREREKKSPPRE